MIEGYLQPIIEHYTQGNFYKEAQRAKEEFFKHCGVVNEEDSFYEARMDLFIDWFLFDRPLEKEPFPPVKTYYRDHKEKFPQEKLPIYRGLANHLHSLFVLKKQKDGIAVIEDIVYEKPYQVSGATAPLGFLKNEIFEARIVPIGNEWWFAKGFCFHPKEANKFIKKEIEKAKLGPRSAIDQLILELAEMRLKYDRYNHIDPAKIYSREG